MNTTLEQTSTVVRKDEYVTIQVSHPEQMITLKWTGYAPSKAFRSILEEAQQYVRTSGLKRWLADLRQMDAILRQDEHWTVTDWHPRMVTSGLRRMAILTSADYFNRMSVDRIITAASPEMPFEITYFDDLNKAKAWLLASEN
ncbi:MAG: STAS/SEC14 domain-containing protein [Flavobacteriales bacterium]|nr:STAS/SEC14 domain-containing protein [Flavobacteriales bacterium]